MSDVNLNDFNVNSLGDKDKAELRSFLTNEHQKARIQANIHSLTDRCFKKCVTGTIRSGQLDKSEETCLTNCTDRFTDLAQFVVKNLQELRQGGH